jgi:ABC-type multidrug transport system ATPase subunit
LFFARLYGLSGSTARQRIDELLALFELEELRARRYAELSTGNKQRLSVARAMLADPPVLLLDEPTRSLDPLAAARMRAKIRSLAQSDGRTVFLTSHNLAEVEELCDRVAIIGKGSIHALDTPAKLRTMHTEEEQVSITFSSLNLLNAEQALSRAFSRDFFVLEGERAGTFETTVKFKRAPNDGLLNNVLRVLQESGAVIRSVETARATLLDVLESYEHEKEDVVS